MHIIETLNVQFETILISCYVYSVRLDFILPIDFFIVVIYKASAASFTKIGGVVLKHQKQDKGIINSDKALFSSCIPILTTSKILRLLRTFLQIFAKLTTFIGSLAIN